MRKSIRPASPANVCIYTTCKLLPTTLAKYTSIHALNILGQIKIFRENPTPRCTICAILRPVKMCLRRLSSCLLLREHNVYLARLFGSKVYKLGFCTHG